MQNVIQKNCLVMILQFKTTERQMYSVHLYKANKLVHKLKKKRQKKRIIISEHILPEQGEIIFLIDQ